MQPSNNKKFGLNLTNLIQIPKKECHPPPTKKPNLEPKTVKIQKRSVYRSLQDYIDDIQDYLVMQSCIGKINPEYMSWQTQITAQMRRQLVNWIIEIHYHLKLQEETLHQSVNLIDRYTDLKNLSKNQYQLVGITSLFVAAKFIQVKLPKIKNFLQLCSGFYSEASMIKMEGDILNSLNFSLNNVLPYNLLENRIQILVGEGSKIKEVCMYILNLLLIEDDFCSMDSSYATALIIYLSSKVKEMQKIGSKKMIKVFKLNPKTFKEYFERIVGVFSKRHEEKYEIINLKYRMKIN